MMSTRTIVIVLYCAICWSLAYHIAGDFDLAAPKPGTNPDYIVVEPEHTGSSHNYRITTGNSSNYIIGEPENISWGQPGQIITSGEPIGIGYWRDTSTGFWVTSRADTIYINGGDTIYVTDGF